MLFLKGEGSIYNIQNTLTSEICDHVRVVTIVISRGSRDREMSQSGKSQIVKRKEKKIKLGLKLECMPVRRGVTCARVPKKTITQIKKDEGGMIYKPLYFPSHIPCESKYIS